jgi:hypothetical protein
MPMVATSAHLQVPQYAVVEIGLRVEHEALTATCENRFPG